MHHMQSNPGEKAESIDGSALDAVLRALASHVTERAALTVSDVS